MVRNEARWLATVDAFHAAATGTWPWGGALRRLADVTGSRSGQLVCVGANNSKLFNILADSDPSHGLPADERSFGLGIATPADRPADRGPNPWEQCRRDPLYRQMLRPADRPFVFLSTLAALDDVTIGLMATRSQHEQQITDDQREMFAALVPHARSALRIQMALERNGTAVLEAALEALEIPVFIADRTGCITAMTGPAEALVGADCGLHLEAGKQLTATNAVEARALASAIESASQAVVGNAVPVARTLVVRSTDNSSSPLVLDVYPLPSPSSLLRLTPRAMIVARGARLSAARRAIMLRTLYDLTAAETNIAEQLAEGRVPIAIAQRRGVAVGTVRAQIKTIMAKVGVSRQIELSARLRQI